MNFARVGDFAKYTMILIWAWALSWAVYKHFRDCKDTAAMVCHHKAGSAPLARLLSESVAQPVWDIMYLVSAGCRKFRGTLNRREEESSN